MNMAMAGPGGMVDLFYVIPGTCASRGYVHRAILISRNSVLDDKAEVGLGNNEHCDDDLKSNVSCTIANANCLDCMNRWIMYTLSSTMF